MNVYVYMVDLYSTAYFPVVASLMVEMGADLLREKQLCSVGVDDTYSCMLMVKQQSTNRILANVRSGASRTSEMFNELCGEIVHAWDEVVNGGEKGTGEKQLWAAFVLTSLAAGMEAGFVVPKVGGCGDGKGEWLLTRYT